MNLPVFDPLLPDAAQKLVIGAIHAANENISEYGRQYPVLIAVHPQCPTPLVVALEIRDRQSKEAAFEAVRNVRAKWPFVVVLLESWTVRGLVASSMQEAQRMMRDVQEIGVENHPARVEVVALNLYMEDREEHLTADIIRFGDAARLTDFQQMIGEEGKTLHLGSLSGQNQPNN